MEARRLKVEAVKVLTGFHLASDVVDMIKATGQGYNARVERVLRKALAGGKLDQFADPEGADALGKP